MPNENTPLHERFFGGKKQHNWAEDQQIPAHYPPEEPLNQPLAPQGAVESAGLPEIEAEGNPISEWLTNRDEENSAILFDQADTENQFHLEKHLNPLGKINELTLIAYGDTHHPIADQSRDPTVRLEPYKTISQKFSPTHWLYQFKAALTGRTNPEMTHDPWYSSVRPREWIQALTGLPESIQKFLTTKYQNQSTENYLQKKQPGPPTLILNLGDIASDGGAIEDYAYALNEHHGVHIQLEDYLHALPQFWRSNVKEAFVPGNHETGNKENRVGLHMAAAHMELVGYQGWLQEIGETKLLLALDTNLMNGDWLQRTIAQLHDAIHRHTPNEKIYRTYYEKLFSSMNIQRELISQALQSKKDILLFGHEEQSLFTMPNFELPTMAMIEASETIPTLKTLPNILELSQSRVVQIIAGDKHIATQKNLQSGSNSILNETNQPILFSRVGARIVGAMGIEATLTPAALHITVSDTTQSSELVPIKPINPDEIYFQDKEFKLKSPSSSTQKNPEPFI